MELIIPIFSGFSDILISQTAVTSGPISITMNKASGGDGLLANFFQILKDDALKVLHSICQ